MSSSTDMNNKPETESTVDRYYHNTQSFFSKYKGVLFVLALLVVGYFLYKNYGPHSSTSATPSATIAPSGTTQAQQLIGGGELLMGPPVQLDTDMRKFLRL